MGADIHDALAMLADPFLLFVILTASIYGLFIGAMPGLTATLATVLLVPFTLSMDPLPAVAAIITMSAMAIFAGDIPSALVRMPGTPASAAYTNDAYPLTQAGKGGLVLGVSLLGSAIGGMIGAFALILAAPALAEFAVRFTSFEYFWVAVLGLTASVIVSQGSQVKGAISLLLGLLMATVGLDITLGYPRFTFGSIDLLSGISFVPAMIGLFGLTEIIRMTLRPAAVGNIPTLNTTRMLRESAGTIWKYRRGAAQGSAIGAFIGALPGAGADIAAWVSYAVTKNFSSNGHKFGRGQGHIEPIVSAGSANNSAIASAYVPAFAFGIPGDTVTAILLGVLLVKGIQPGPALFAENASFMYGIYGVFILANLLMIPLGWLLIRSSRYVFKVPPGVLRPVILIFCIVGSFAASNGYAGVIIMLALGVLGYIVATNGYPLAPIVLGLVLGPIVEVNFMQSVIKTDWDLTQFLSRPISASMMVLTISILLYPIVVKPLKRRSSRS